MQPPLSAGTVLQNRYRLVDVLGQGGFGRTYLAEDQGRFDERCALKEFMPPSNDPYALDKGRELFQREAAVLYQIEHPQIPEFQATFEDQGRVFLVQDYVAGQTYRQLLTARSQGGQVFADSEIQHLLNQLLPVLSYLHGLGIVHRDIAPDNIILRDRDQLPVLIDFGVVKELASRIYDPNATVVQATSVGKSGFAPSEQIQTGRAYPSSDLYALAATAVVLLTGREPQDLFDDRELRWNWRPYAQVSPGLATVLDTMLSHQPGQRYGSANEVLQALAAGGGGAVNATVEAAGMPGPPMGSAMPVPQDRTGYPVPRTAPRSPAAGNPARTVAIGRPAPKTEALGLDTGLAAGGSSDYVPRAADDDAGPRSIWEGPWTVMAVGIGLVLATGFASWALVNWLLRPQPQVVEPTPTPTAIASPTPTPTPTPTVSETPEIYTQALELRPGIPVQDEGNLKSNQVLVYRLYGERGQELEMRLAGDGVLGTILAPGGSPLGDGARGVTQWKGILPAPGSYEIELRTTPGVPESRFTIFTQLNPAPAPTIPLPTPDATITPAPTPTPTTTPTQSPRPTPTPTPTPQPSPSPTTPSSPQPTPQSRSFQGVVRNNRSETRSLTAQGNQTLRVTFNSPAARLTVYGPDGSPVNGFVNRRDGTASFTAPTAGTYEFEIKTDVETQFNLQVNVR